MNKLTRALSLAAPIAALALWNVGDASACGGYFGPATEVSAVTGHRMVLSIAKAQTTLWDQITYSGSPSSFAWVLPVKGVATVGLSSDALFGELDAYTQVEVQAPDLACLSEGFGGGEDGAGGGGVGGGSGGGVTIVSQAVVGPYETVQLSSSDPAALTTWLTQHGYAIPADVQPIIAAYVGEQFDFLALKLVPGKSVSAMRPVRVTTPGASPVLPLRMVAAGTGTTTPITLWVMGEGRYDTVNLPSFQIDSTKIVWDWDTSTSNLAALGQSGFDLTQQRGWLIEAGEPFSKFDMAGELSDLVTYDAAESGYADDMGMGADQALKDDLAALYGMIPDTSLWVTRLHGQLSRAALAADLQLGASSAQTEVPRYFVATQTKGTPPCVDGAGGAGGAGSSGTSGGSHGCSTGASGRVPDAMLVSLAVAALLARRRRSRSGAIRALPR